MHAGDAAGGLTAVKVDEEDPLEVFVVDEHCVASRTRLVVDGEVTPVRVPPKHVVLLLVYDQFLKETARSNAKTETWTKAATQRPKFAHLCL